MIQPFPAPKELASLPPEDIAALLLEYLNQRGSQTFNRSNLMNPHDALREYIEGGAAEVLAEGWSLLVNEGLLVQSPSDSYGMNFFVSRRGKEIKTRTDFRSYRLGNLLPAELLDTSLAESVRPLFLRGDYDTAVFRAFREVEQRVRDAGGFPDEVLGIPLMRAAFHPDAGPLTDKTITDRGEREAMQHLFAGAIGTFKNPSSHRAEERVFCYP